MMDGVREVHTLMKLQFPNNFIIQLTLNFRQQAYDAMAAAGKRCISFTTVPNECGIRWNWTVCKVPTRRFAPFRWRIREAGIFHHLITLADLPHCSTVYRITLQKRILSVTACMLGWLLWMHQRKEILPRYRMCCKYQKHVWFRHGDDHKEYFKQEKCTQKQRK